MKLYMTYLTNTYDSHFALIDEDNFHWVKTGEIRNAEKMETAAVQAHEKLNLSNNIVSNVPREQLIEEFSIYFKEIDPEPDARAYAAPAVIVNDELLMFSEIKNMMDAVRKYNIEIVDVYEGYIL